MAQSKHRRKGARRLPRNMTVGGKTATFTESYRAQRPSAGTVMPTERELRDALASIPEDLGWDWARPRLTPLFERADGAGVDGDPTINTVTPMGVAIGFGIEIGPTFARVTRSMATRWEASTEQIADAAFNHLADVIHAVSSKHLQHAVHKGYMMRCLPEPGGWASSAILAGDGELCRIFGSHDQIFATPGRNMLLSFDASVPMHAVLEMTALFEDADPHPLLIDPFILHDGRLIWAGVAVLDEDEPLA